MARTKFNRKTQKMDELVESSRVHFVCTNKGAHRPIRLLDVVFSDWVNDPDHEHLGWEYPVNIAHEDDLDRVGIPDNSRERAAELRCTCGHASRPSIAVIWKLAQAARQQRTDSVDVSGLPW